MTRVALAVVLAASLAHADDRKTRADATYRDGEQLYAAKQYLAAAAKFEDAYAIDPDPAVLFNIAQAYRLGRACAQAARYYHRFTDLVPNPPDRDKLDHYIAEMDTCAKAEAGAAQPTVIHDTTIVHDTRVVHDTKVITRRKTLVPGLVVAGVGVVALGFGAYFTHDVHDAESAAARICAAGCTWSAALPAIQHEDDRGHRAELGEAVGYAVGVGALVTGAVLIVLGRGDHVEPVVTPAGAGVSARWRF